MAAAGVAALGRGERGRGGNERVLVDREVLERLSGAVEATLEHAQRRERAAQRPVEDAGDVFGAERPALVGEQRLDRHVAAADRRFPRGWLEQVGDGDAERPGELKWRR